MSRGDGDAPSLLLWRLQGPGVRSGGWQALLAGAGRQQLALSIMSKAIALERPVSASTCVTGVRGTPGAGSPVRALSSSRVADLGDGSGERGLAVVDVADGAHVEVRLGARVDVIVDCHLSRPARRQQLQRAALLHPAGMRPAEHTGRGAAWHALTVRSQARCRGKVPCSPVQRTASAASASKAEACRQQGSPARAGGLQRPACRRGAAQQGGQAPPPSRKGHPQRHRLQAGRSQRRLLVRPAHCLCWRWI